MPVYRNRQLPPALQPYQPPDGHQTDDRRLQPPVNKLPPTRLPVNQPLCQLDAGSPKAQRPRVARAVCRVGRHKRLCHRLPVRPPQPAFAPAQTPADFSQKRNAVVPKVCRTAKRQVLPPNAVSPVMARARLPSLDQKQRVFLLRRRQPVPRVLQLVVPLQLVAPKQLLVLQLAVAQQP